MLERTVVRCQQCLATAAVEQLSPEKHTQACTGPSAIEGPIHSHSDHAWVFPLQTPVMIQMSTVYTDKGTHVCHEGAKNAFPCYIIMA